MKQKSGVAGGGRVWADVSPALVEALDDVVGTFYGTTREEVVEFILKNWLSEHWETLEAVRSGASMTIR